ncbi:extracellular solute-binding protein [Ruania halotolerans]|uniref:extracellular solute-binding protein n=1 Tax=Ruania halotolerans TaxID=2897773 RepID=UPI001E61382F|nr:extracellular solute-binding protein [Ruania halotolerans]UFU06435.1 extracellular solute-binding protein [Ruania halotolerans]
MKRTRPIVLGAALTSVTLVAACAGAGEDTEVSSLDLWLPPHGDFSNASEWDPILAAFEEEHGIDVNVRMIPWENYEEAYLTGITGGEGPDVGLMYAEMIGDYHAQGALVPFDEYLPNSDAPDYLYLDQGQVDGEQIAVPLVVGGARVLYYNADLLAQAGIEEPPGTWDEFLEAGRQLRDAGITPAEQAWSGHPGILNDNFYPMLWQAGGELFTEDGSATAFNSPEGVAAAEFLWELRDSEILSEAVTSLVQGDVQSNFANGQTAFMFGSDAHFPTFDAGDFELGLIGPLEGETRETFIAADALVLLEQCPDRQLCTDLVTYITSPDQMAEFHELAPYPPITAGAEYVAPQIFEEMYAQSDLFNGLPIVAGSSAVYNTLLTNLQQMMLGEKTPEQALADAATSGDQALETAQQ